MKSHRSKQNAIVSQQQHKKYVQVQKNLTYLLKNYQKQLHQLQDIQKCYNESIQHLENKIKILKDKFVMTKIIQPGQMTSSNICSIESTKLHKQKVNESSNQIKFMNHLKFNDLKEQIQNISHQLKKVSVQAKNNIKTMSESKLFNNSSVMIKSKMFSVQKRIQNLSEMSESYNLKQEQSLGQILNSEDQIVINLCKNMLIQEEKFICSIQKLQNISIQEMLTIQLKKLTLKNDAQIYRMTSNERNRELQIQKNRKNLVKFGYTQTMKELVRNKNKRSKIRKQ